MARPGHALFGFGPKKPDAPAPVAVAAAVEGSATYQAKGTAPAVKLNAGQKLEASDKITTAEGSKVTIALSDGTKFQVGENASFQVETLEAKKVSIHVAVGLLDAWVTKVKKRRFQVRTPTAVASVRGTQLQVSVDVSGHTDVFCFTGSIDVAPPTGGRGVEVSAGQTVTADVGKVSDAVAAPEAKATPVEPAVEIPAAAPAQAPEATPAPQEPAPTEPAPDANEAPPTEGDGTATTNEPPPPPPPNPSQDANTVSPSAP